MILMGRLSYYPTPLNLKAKLDGTQPFPPCPLAIQRLPLGRRALKLVRFRPWGLQCFIIVLDLDARRLSPRGGVCSRELTLILNTDVGSVGGQLQLNPGHANVDVLGIPVRRTEVATC